MRAALAALALALGLVLTGCGDKPLEEQPGYDEANQQAGFRCAYRVQTGYYSDEFQRCLEIETKRIMEENK
jgi:hypothetical protein